MGNGQLARRRRAKNAPVNEMICVNKPKFRTEFSCTSVCFLILLCFLIKVPGKQSLFYILLWKRHALPSNKRIESSRRTIRLVAPNLTDEIYLPFVYVLKKISNIRLFFRYYVSWLEILVILTFGFPNYISETYSRFFVVVVESVFEKVSHLGSNTMLLNLLRYLLP